MEEIVKHINDTNASYRPLGVGDAKNTDLFLDNEHYQLFEGAGDQITVRYHKENLAKAILFIASILPRKFDQSSVHCVIPYSKSFVVNQLALLDALFVEDGKSVETITQEWNARKDVPQKNGKIDTRFYFNGLLKDVVYTDSKGKECKRKFTIRNYLAGGYSELHIKKADDGKFDIEITNVNTPYYDGKEDGLEEKEVMIKPSSRQIIYYGAPGTGKSHTIKKEEDEGKITCMRTTFHPDSDYATFVGCYKPHKCKESGELTYEFVEQAFLSAYKQAWMNPDKKIALVIEEINRGNCAQVFGDIFQLLDRDEDGWSTYPIKADTDIAEHLAESHIQAYAATMKERFGKDKQGNEKYPDRNWFEFMALPPNMSILATMNTSDQSLFPIDSAFKRRWDWRYIPICQGKSNGEDGKQDGELLDWKIETSTEKNSWWDFLRAINGIIESTTHSEDKELGFFFCKANQEGVISAEKFVNKVVFYLWTDVFKTYGFRSDIFNKDVEGKEKIAFKDFFDRETGAPNGDTVKLFIENVMKHLPKENVENE